MYSISKQHIPKITSIQDKLSRMGLFKDKVDGKPGMTTWEAIEASLKELAEFREFNSSLKID